MSLELTNDQKISSFLGYLGGYFDAKGGDAQNIIAIRTEMTMRFCKKHNIPFTQELYNFMDKSIELVLSEQFNSIITELMEENWKPNNTCEGMGLEK